ncbi:M20 family metallo-hydrolase [Corynebacterium aurimucosum]|uniref:N-carbamoyl-beta-alanine amidohydrolase n=1 Tax=Corynebacterium aurimucosum (strain ATCC 700975 / DSM 44827 / CIP 107346 / CN-1) TaxID=548476 RepID=C3PEH0_CORA7|nr:M20 family metallo-hydrolase [Corynebacterium aurimucosum]ACP32224.1 N-carbamoyl-beta-alanine amidohydrolase [Corynebacterium aurimucosum ATCC 700975]QQU93583.1 M20 family metallo-hydrolase [Corynebacterium aurimucosum]
MRATTNEQFLADFQAMSANGATPGGGVERQAASAGDNLNRAWFHEVLESLGARVIYDEIGNQYGLFELVPGAEYVGLGSHLDSQPLAGRFDGAYGVLAAAHAAGRVAQSGVKARYNLAVINWFNEEGSRFAPSMMGSSVFVGTLALDRAHSATDLSGVTVAQAQEEAGWSPRGEAPKLAAYAEIHVEQGKELEAAGNTIGLVTATWGAKKFQAVVSGEQGHTGSTLMADRKDALFGASLIIASVERLTHEFDEGQLQASVSQLTLEPNSPVTIAREVRFNVDVRSPSTEVLDKAQARLQEIIAEAEEESRTSVELSPTHEWALNPYPEAGVELAREVVEELGYPHQEIYTVAGHDSTNLKEVVPTVMLFIPSVDGISHNEKEFTTEEDCVAGLDVLTHVAQRLVENGCGED